MITGISSLCGIAGFIFSVIIWARTKDLRDQINVYKRNQKTLVEHLTAYRDSVIKDNLYTLDIRSSIRTELYSILQDYGAVFSFWVKLRVHWTIHLLNSGKNNVDQEKLCNLLDWIIARIHRKENRS